MTDCVIDAVTVEAFTIPTDAPEADGTIEWKETTMVTVVVRAADVVGFGYTYASVAAASVIEHTLAGYVLGTDPLSPRTAYNGMVRAVRNAGRSGIASTAISAVDIAIHDLKAKILGVPLAVLAGKVRDSIPVYGSGGFTSYDNTRLQNQLGRWASQGIRAVKMKIGTNPGQDVERVRAARSAVGAIELYVDANGAFHAKQALAFAEKFRDLGVTWFEEPVSSDDLAGLRLMRERGPAGMDIAAGEYGYTVSYFRYMLAAEAVDVLQIDATRCGGVTAFLDASAVADSFEVPVSAHTAPTLHGHLCCAASRAKNVEYFYDHTRIEQMLFDGALVANDGNLAPNLTEAGLGIRFRQQDARQFLTYSAHIKGGAEIQC